MYVSKKNICSLYTVYEHAFANIRSPSHNHTQSSRAVPCQIAGAAKKLRLGAAKAAATGFSCASKELRFISASEKLRFHRFSPGCAQNLTKKFKFFQKKLQKFKKIN